MESYIGSLRKTGIKVCVLLSVGSVYSRFYTQGHMLSTEYTFRKGTKNLMPFFIMNVHTKKSVATKISAVIWINLLQSVNTENTRTKTNLTFKNIVTKPTKCSIVTTMLLLSTRQRPIHSIAIAFLQSINEKYRVGRQASVCNISETEISKMLVLSEECL